MSLRNRFFYALSLAVLSFGILFGAYAVWKANFRKPATDASQPAAAKTAEIRLPNGFTIDAAIAANPEDQERGLGGRDSMQEDFGMLFLYDQPSVPKFWMKDMRFDLDLIWIDGGKIVGVEANVPKESYASFETFSPDVPITSVLEVNAGFFFRQGLNVGDELQIAPQP